MSTTQVVVTNNLSWPLNDISSGAQQNAYRNPSNYAELDYDEELDLGTDASNIGIAEHGISWMVRFCCPVMSCRGYSPPGNRAFTDNLALGFPLVNQMKPNNFIKVGTVNYGSIPMTGWGIWATGDFLRLLIGNAWNGTYGADNQFKMIDVFGWGADYTLYNAAGSSTPTDVAGPARGSWRSFAASLSKTGTLLVSVDGATGVNGTKGLGHYAIRPNDNLITLPGASVVASPMTKVRLLHWADHMGVPTCFWPGAAGVWVWKNSALAYTGLANTQAVLNAMTLAPDDDDWLDPELVNTTDLRARCYTGLSDWNSFNPTSGTGGGGGRGLMLVADED